VPAPADSSQQAAAEASLRFLQDSHHKALDALHGEVGLLQQKNADLSFRLLMMEELSTDLAAAKGRIRELEDQSAELAKKASTEATQAAAATAAAEAATAAVARATEQLEAAAGIEAGLRDRVKVLERQFTAAQSLSPTAKVRYTTSASAGAVEGAAVAPHRPSPPRPAAGGRIRQHTLFRRASSIQIDRSTAVAEPEELQRNSLPQYPEPVPPIRASGDA